jgi:hypothetical protein
MSKGPGIWERMLLAVLEKYSSAILTDLLPRPYSRSQYVALHRAAYNLERKGMVDIYHPQLGSHFWIAKPGYECERRDQVPRLSVEQVSCCTVINT